MPKILHCGHRGRSPLKVALCLMLALTVTWGIPGYGSSLLYIESADGTKSKSNFAVIRNTHARLAFSQDIQRIAIGNPSIVEMDVLAGREILMIAKNIGKTSVIIWYTDGSAEPLTFDVIEDLTVLKGVLKDIHPAISIEMAPDRAALILRGTVSSIRVKMDAEAATRSYLSSNGGNSFDIFTPNPAPTNEEQPTPRIAIINLLKTDEVAFTTEQKLQNAVGFLSDSIVAKRISKGQVANDALDTYLLEGEVENQVELTQVLNIAASVLGITGGGITVVTDEGGGLGASSSLGANVARAKMLSVADGRILSMIQVRNIPQVRVAVQMYEVNRSRLREWSPDFKAITDNYAVNEPQNGSGQTGATPGVFSARDIDVANALQIINGTLSNNIQIATQDVAFDVLFGMLEEEGISRVLSNPTISVLSGEEAVFEVGGQIPIPSAYSQPGVGVVNNAGQQQPSGGVLVSSVEFKQYGVMLKVFPQVDENNMIMLDVRPEISNPDIALTQQIAAAGGGGQQTTAFSSRSIQTKAHVRDGQPMIIGGLITRSHTEVSSYPQGIGNFPIFSSVSRDSNKAEVTTELVIIVTPTIVQQPLKQNGLWQYPAAFDLLQQAVGIPARDDLTRNLRRREMYE